MLQDRGSHHWRKYGRQASSIDPPSAFFSDSMFSVVISIGEQRTSDNPVYPSRLDTTFTFQSPNVQNKLKTISLVSGI